MCAMTSTSGYRMCTTCVQRRTHEEVNKKNPAQAIMNHELDLLHYFDHRNKSRPLIATIQPIAATAMICVFYVAFSLAAFAQAFETTTSSILATKKTASRWLTGDKSADLVFADDFAKLQAHKALLEDGEDDERSRNLVWAETASQCSPELLSALTFTPTLCIYTVLQWDPAGTFTATSVFTTTPTPFLDTIIQLPVNSYIGYYNGNVCNNFDGCSFVDDGEIVSGQYLYDCSNVYCGPNAIRDCNGNYQDLACPAGAAPGDIPFLREVNCLRVSQLLDNAAGVSCGSCQASDDLPFSSISCNINCLGCNSENACFSSREEFGFGESADVDQICYENHATGDVACELKFGPAGRNSGPLRLHGCSVEVNGEECSCSICGFQEGADDFGLQWYRLGEVLYEAQCPDGSGFSQCTGAVAGFYATGILDPNARCPSTSGSMPISQPTMMMSPVVMAPPVMVGPPPVAPVVQPVAQPMAQPMAQPVAQPVLQPVVQPVVAPSPIVLPVSQPVASPTSVDNPTELPPSPELPPLLRNAASSGYLVIPIHFALPVVVVLGWYSLF